jgi:hypothetical protein
LSFTGVRRTALGARVPMIELLADSLVEVATSTNVVRFQCNLHACCLAEFYTLGHECSFVDTPGLLKVVN